MINFLHKHPWDWIAHCLICALAGYLKTHPIIAIGGMLIFEYEQRFQRWYEKLFLMDYICLHAAPDMIANLLGYIYVWKWILKLLKNVF